MPNEKPTYAYFRRDPCSIDELQGQDGAKRYQVTVAKQIELTMPLYRHFATHLWMHMPFIAANKALAHCDEVNSVSRCLLVTAQGRKDGILVNCQGCDFASSAAYVPNKAVLDLSDVPMEHCGKKLRGKQEFRVR